MIDPNKQMAIDLLEEQLKEKENLISDLRSALESLATNADEDCPSVYRGKHFRQALEDAFALIAYLND